MTRFFKVREVSASNGHMKLKVWFRTKWVDERLSWILGYGYHETQEPIANIWPPGTGGFSLHDNPGLTGYTHAVSGDGEAEREPDLHRHLSGPCLFFLKPSSYYSLTNKRTTYMPGSPTLSG